MVANDHYVVVTVECSRCKTKRKVHIADSIIPIAPQMIPCINYDNPFKVVVPDKILRGPFPAYPSALAVIVAVLELQ
jgi:hypothetical protein